MITIQYLDVKEFSVSVSVFVSVSVSVAVSVLFLGVLSYCLCIPQE